MVAFITVIALLTQKSVSSYGELDSQQGHAQEMIERIHVMIVMCHKENDGSTKEEVTIVVSFLLYDMWTGWQF